MTYRLTRILIPALTSAALLAVGAGMTVLTQSSETMLRSSFERALVPVIANEQTASVSRQPLAGSEEFWLTAMTREAASPLSKGVSLGERITFTLDGQERQYRVTSVSEFAPGKTEIDTRASAVRLVLVTARDTTDITARTVRFVMEIEGAPASIIPGQPARTL